jgi:hypothetical protein
MPNFTPNTHTPENYTMRATQEDKKASKTDPG